MLATGIRSLLAVADNGLRRPELVDKGRRQKAFGLRDIWLLWALCTGGVRMLVLGFLANIRLASAVVWCIMFGHSDVHDA